MRIAVSGASGFIGSALVPALRADGHVVTRLVRHEPRGEDEIGWDPAAGRLDPDALRDTDAVVHLSGASVGGQRWSTRYKQTLLHSRVDSTRTLAEAIARADPGPRTLLCASAVGWYGDTGDRTVDESAPAGEGFLAQMCRRWEAATEPAARAGVRVVRMRSGLVLAAGGGLLSRLLPLYRLGLGGRLGSGRQYWPWISRVDEVRAMVFLLTNEAISGPVNLAGPQPATNATLNRALGRLVHRPAVLPVPAVGLRLALGEFADEGILAGQRVVPRALTEAGFTFCHASLDDALAAALADRDTKAA